MEMLGDDNSALVPFSRKLLESFKKNDLTRYDQWFMDERVTRYNSHGLLYETQKEVNRFLASSWHDPSPSTQARQLRSRIPRFG